MEEKKYPAFEEEEKVGMVSEPVVAPIADTETVTAMPDDMDYAHIIDGVLQITPDIEEEIAQVERGEIVSMSEFQTMFAKWLD